MSEGHEKNSKRGTAFVVAAPSGAGKTSLVKALVEQNEHVCVATSHTTRASRPGETDGLSYFFIEQEQFREMIANHEFVEWAEVFGNLYGTTKQEVSRILDQGMNLILEIDWQGAQQIRSEMKTAKTIFIFPPSLQTLRERLKGRAQDDESTVQQRMDSAIDEISHFNEFDYLIVNDDFEQALTELNQVIEGTGDELATQAQQERLKPLTNALLS